MNRTYLKHEFLITTRSKRNIPFILFMAVLLLSYCLILLPNKETKETYYPEEVRDYLTTLEVEQKFREEKGNTGIIIFTGQPVYAMNAYYYKLNHAMLTAYEDKNYTRFLYLRNFTLLGNEREYTADPNLFTLSPFPGKDRAHLYQQTMMRYEDYLENDYPITYGLMYEKTGLQALQKFLQTNGILFILFCVIYFSSDILSRDRKYQTVLQGMPLSWYRQLNLKSLSTFLYSLLIIAVMLVVGVIVMSLQFGFGYFDLHVPIMIGQQLFTAEDYDVISIATFIGKTFMGIPLLVFLFIRLNIILGLILKNEWVVLLVSSLILFLDRLFATRTTRELFGQDISFFPQIYFDFGKIVDGEKNFLLNVETITFAKGLVVLLVTIAVIEALLFICSRIINKRRFYKA
ncbi:hypothetical protein [Sporosarcina highlanderae]|uniref:ABC transporter permease n=1 Tax=Sporosarcina highlanderae TaxID=3035916 RepID=A0ABT8JP21_9BACL|nr:hypothetical protein [Sporosarcina highlanderae]MDN4606890.1 hypothetical protein [Sporosarcina highlanderae]